ncbi:MAG: hypothetical protein AAF456_11570 [Planctomycetota bacterium]
MDANEYWPILSDLKVNGTLQKFLRIELDAFTTWTENPYPPCMIPLWSTFGQVIIGYWRHWFAPDSGSYVIYAPESNHIREIALSVDQVKAYILFNIAGDEEELDDEFEQASQLLEYSETDRVADFREQYGFDYEGYLNEYYRDQLPLSACADHSIYNGSLPQPPYNEETVANFCSYELAPGEMAKVEKKPIWLDRGSVKQGFDEAIEAGDLKSAWLSLCSSGWKASEAAESLTRIADLAGDAILDRYAEGLLTAFCNDQ